MKLVTCQVEARIMGAVRFPEAISSADASGKDGDNTLLVWPYRVGSLLLYYYTLLQYDWYD